MNCSNCGKEFDMHSNIDDESLKPKEDDISICMYCGEIGQFKNGKLELIDIRVLPEDTQKEIMKIEVARQRVMSVA